MCLCRKIYDEFGKNGLDAHEKGQDPRTAGFGGGFPGGGGGGQRFHFNNGGGGGFDPFTMFEQFFAHEGGGGGGGFGGGGFPGGFPGGGGFGGHQQRQVEELYPKSSPVARLGRRKFPDASSKNIWLVTFYDNNNKACVEHQPIMNKLATKMAGTVKVGAVNCEKEADFCFQEMNVSPKRLPAFAVVVEGDVTMYEEGKSTTAKALHEFTSEKMPSSLVSQINRIEHVQERLMTNKLGSGNQRHTGAILLLTDKYETSNLYISLAYAYRKSLTFGESRASNLQLGKEFGVKKYPLLLALLPSNSNSKGYSIVKYSGEMKSEPISKWIDSILMKNNENAQKHRRRKR